jgi:hypothetical protein
MDQPTKKEPLTESDLKDITLPLSLETYERLANSLIIRNRPISWTQLSPELKKAYGEMNKQIGNARYEKEMSRFD